MKLFYARGACSMSPHIALEELGLPYSIEKVDLQSKKTASGADYTAINPKGMVPALQLDDGQILTEGPAIVQYIADKVPAKKLLPAVGSAERYHVIEWLNFIGTELYKQYSPLFPAEHTRRVPDDCAGNPAQESGLREPTSSRQKIPRRRSVLGRGCLHVRHVELGPAREARSIVASQSRNVRHR